MSPLPTLQTIEALDEAIAGSATRPVVLLKHSLTCGTSRRAHAEVERLLDDPPIDADVFVIPIQEARPVSAAVAERFGIGHESPQVLVIHAGQATWHAAHWGVTASAIREAVARLGTAASSSPV